MLTWVNDFCRTECNNKNENKLLTEITLKKKSINITRGANPNASNNINDSNNKENQNIKIDKFKVTEENCLLIKKCFCNAIKKTGIAYI